MKMCLLMACMCTIDRVTAIGSFPWQWATIFSFSGIPWPWQKLQLLGLKWEYLGLLVWLNVDVGDCSKRPSPWLATESLSFTFLQVKVYSKRCMETRQSSMKGRSCQSWNIHSLEQFPWCRVVTTCKFFPLISLNMPPLFYDVWLLICKERLFLCLHLVLLLRFMWWFMIECFL